MSETAPRALAMALTLADAESPVRGIALAVSGGPDSMALLAAARATASLDSRLASAWVLHVDHGIRPQSRAESRLVEEEARRAGHPVRILRLPDRPPERGSLEAWARICRYDALRAVMTELGLDLLVTAHHRGDQAETVALGLMRGGGALALQGMASLRPLGQGQRLARPFLGIDRETLDRFRRESGMVAVDDASNRFLGHRRNLIRHLALSSEGRLEADRLLALAARARGLDERVANWAAKEMDGRHPTSDRRFGVHEVSIDDHGFDDLPTVAARAFLRALLARVNRPELMPSRAAIRRLQVDGAMVELARDCHASRSIGRLRLEHRLATPRLAERRLRPDEEVEIKGFGRIGIRPGQASPEGTSREQWLPRAELNGPLVVRSPRPGERLQPFGMKGTKSVLEIFREQGVAARERDGHPVVADDLGILWIPGLRASERCRVSGEGTPGLLLAWTP